MAMLPAFSGRVAGCLYGSLLLREEIHLNKVSAFFEKEKVAGYVLITPFLIGLFVFTLYPFFHSLHLSFTQYDVLTPAKWIGNANYVRMFTDDKLFWKAFFNSFKFALIEVPLKLSFSLFEAVLLSRETKLMPFFRASFYIPSLMGGSVAVALMWKQLFAYKGVINQLLALVGIEGVKWLTYPGTAMGVLIALGVWQFGSSMLIFLAAIRNIPASYHEAAIVDGASSVRRFFAIVLPMLTPTILFNLINQIIGSLQVFNSGFLITEGKPLNSTLFYNVYVYNRAFTYHEMGYASAMAWFMLLVIALLTALVFKSSNSWVYYETDRR